MKTQKNRNKFSFFIFFLFSLFMTSCEKHEYCVKCWENKPLLGGAGDVSFCSDDLLLVDEFIQDYEYSGWECKLKD